jgi:cardiolipin synthase (CMP-forming)
VERDGRGSELAARPGSIWYILTVPRWLPNAICFLRIALIPAWLIHAWWCVEEVRVGGSGEGHRALAVAALLGIGVSDVLDGAIARRFHLETKFGENLDAIADKLAQVALLIFLAFSFEPAFERVPVPFLALVLGGDLVLVTGYLLIRARRGSVTASHAPHGKVASLLIFSLLLAVTFGVSRSWTGPLWWIAGVAVVVSTLAYVRGGWRQWTSEC